MPISIDKAHEKIRKLVLNKVNVPKSVRPKNKEGKDIFEMYSYFVRAMEQDGNTCEYSKACLKMIVAECGENSLLELMELAEKT